MAEANECVKDSSDVSKSLSTIQRRPAEDTAIEPLGIVSEIECVPIDGHDWPLFFGLEWTGEFARWLCIEDRLVGLFEYLVQDGQKLGIVDAKLPDGGV